MSFVNAKFEVLTLQLLGCVHYRVVYDRDILRVCSNQYSDAGFASWHNKPSATRPFVQEIYRLTTKISPKLRIRKWVDTQLNAYASQKSVKHHYIFIEYNVVVILWFACIVHGIHNQSIFSIHLAIRLLL